jgi:dimethylargininase
MSSTTAAPSASRVSLAKRLATSLLTALAVAAATHVANIVMLSLASQLSTGAVLEFHNRFLSSTLFLLIALFVFGFLGIFTRWFFALPAGIVLGIASALGGLSLYARSQSLELPVAQLLETLLGLNLPFVLSTALAAVFIGVPLERRLLASPRGSVAAPSRRTALVRVPADNLAEGIVSRPAAGVDVELANTQWDAYVSALLANGWSTIEVAPAPTLADSVFVEDAAVVFDGTAVIASPGAESRKAEPAEVERSLVDLGLSVERIVEPGTLDGGDVLKVGDTVYVGRGGRTNAEGIRQLRAILAGTRWRVVAVPVTEVLHLKSAVTALPDGTVIGDPAMIGDTSVFERFLAMPEPGAEVVVLGPDTVLMAASAPRSAALIEDLGYRVVTVDISEFEKLDGCVTCLSIRIR